ncbi:hypothetical protein DAPPUDRAFT_304406 [Daphnia pulex]|uniref:Uncharacterized protein n=1 Tax=Daphnia pulex TaxID=6669 RepID=E9HUD0_DAPPU|nr:hypothetical protein DAPPUDRAFT_304406 [Daphnia pulex]|eukprot:EFX64652.1 hypothetical protein DAPPUDRAFT_304406 [Daphnia pulex]
MDSISLNADSWTGKLVFTEFDHKGSACIRSEWTHSCLRTDLLMGEICANNNITVIRLYKEHVNPVTSELVHHAFVVFKTESRWKYSIERNKTCITLQRSKCLNDILHAACGGFADTSEQKGKGSIGKVVHFLWRNNYLGEHYHPLRSNCIQFASRIFRAFSIQSDALPIHVCDSSDDDPDNYEC